MKMDSYIDFYRNLTGFSPYEYQKKVAELLLAGKNVILSVPTGTGKTFASVFPFLYAKQYNIESFPAKLIYSLPLRTLANSIHGDLKQILQSSKVCEYYPYLSESLSIQTGEYSDDPYFEKDVILSTIDQTLSNFLCFPLSLSHGQGNIDAGALVGSYLIFDEFHLLDPGLSMATTIGMLRKLKNLCRFCVMTATLTDEYIQSLRQILENTEVVSIKDFPDDKLKIQSLIPAEGKTVKKNISVCHAPLDYKTILDLHKNKTIVICNRVETAQQIFRDLCKEKKDSTEIFCIHSRLFDSDRKLREADIKKNFGKYSNCQDVILVATQIIEAGMDISCDLMFTEISPINSFLQRAGRCARFASEYGHIYICDVLEIKEENLSDVEHDKNNEDEIKKLRSKYLPYSSELCQSTLKTLCKYDYLNEENSEGMINAVLHDDEIRIFKKMDYKSFNAREIKKSWLDCDKKHYRETIRDIQSIDIVLLDFDEKLNKKIVPWQYETVGMFKWSFISKIRKLQEEGLYEPLIAKAEQNRDSVFDFDWQDMDDYYLKEMDISELKYWNDVVFVNNRFFDYGREGLVVRENENKIEAPIKSTIEKTKDDIVYKMDTFLQHNKALLRCYEREFQPKTSFLFEELNRYWKEQYDWDLLIKLSIVFHDYGKLNSAWQTPMLKFQHRKSGNKDFNEIIAHTDFDKSVDEPLAKECGVNKKPPHAGIGASKLYDILMEDFCEEIARVVSCSVLKHHNVDTESSESYVIPENNLLNLKALLEGVGYSCNLCGEHKKSESLSDLIPAGQGIEWLTYFVFVRILRLCDQKATKNIENYI